MQTINRQHPTPASPSQRHLPWLWGNPSASWRVARHETSRRQCVAVCASGVRARWCIDVEYGHKQMVTTLLQEWVAEVGSVAGLSAANTRLSSGSVGVAESRLELEVSFTSLSEWETFLAAIPSKEHRAWSQRVQGMIVGGSPRWELYRSVAVFGEEEVYPPANTAVRTATGTTAPSAAPPASSTSQSNILLPTASEDWSLVVESTGSAGDGSTSSSTGSGLSIINSPQDAEVVLDWKGEPMKLNPGDKLPFKFL